MPKSEKQKLKIFYIADYLMRKTDANGDEEKPNGVYLWQIRDYLKKKGIDAEEHSITQLMYIDALRC